MKYEKAKRKLEQAIDELNTRIAVLHGKGFDTSIRIEYTTTTCPLICVDSFAARQK